MMKNSTGVGVVSEMAMTTRTNERQPVTDVAKLRELASACVAGKYTATTSERQLAEAVLALFDRLERVEDLLRQATGRLVVVSASNWTEAIRREVETYFSAPESSALKSPNSPGAG